MANAGNGPETGQTRVVDETVSARVQSVTAPNQDVGGDLSSLTEEEMVEVQRRRVLDREEARRRRRMELAALAEAGGPV
jgi:hypothetical protein